MPHATRDLFESTDLGRRHLLRAGALTLLGIAIGPLRARAAVAEPRRLRMTSLHTGERIDITYFDGATLVPDALGEIDRFLRDHRTGDTHPIDPAVLDIAWSLAHAAGRPLALFEIVSGYRSPHTNTMLRERSGGVASRSMHLVGKAIDLRLAGVPTEDLRDLAIALRRGGVGFYRESDFVHVDSGLVRHW